MYVYLTNDTPDERITRQEVCVVCEFVYNIQHTRDQGRRSNICVCVCVMNLPTARHTTACRTTTNYGDEDGISRET